MDNFITISALKEWSYCPRRFYLRVFENNQEKNADMIEGEFAHRRVDRSKIEKRGNKYMVTAMPVFSKLLDIGGICDMVVFQEHPAGFYIDFLNKKCLINVIEYKHGKKRNADDYNLQLAAQCMCLEEMFNASISSGTIYYTTANKKMDINITDELKDKVKKVVMEINENSKTNTPIKPKYLKRCRSCSLLDVCNPKTTMINSYMDLLKGDLL